MDSLSKIATRATLLVSNNIFFATCISWLICVSKDVIIDDTGIDWADMPLPFFVILSFYIFTFWIIGTSYKFSIFTIFFN